MNVEKVYKRSFDNPLKEDGTPKENELLGEFEIIEELKEDSYSSIRLGILVGTSKVFIINEYEVSGRISKDGGSRYEVIEIKEVATKSRWINANFEQPTLNDENHSENVLAICNGQLMVMCYCYNPSEDDAERGFFWSNCNGQIDGDADFDDEYDVTFWQYLPSIVGFVA